MTTRAANDVARGFSDSVRRGLVELRRDLHRHPELSFKETRTSEKLQAALSPLNPAELRRVTETAVVARIRGRNPNAPVVAVRGDIDALPVTEATGLEYASVNNGVMHACGHDVHATWAVGAAHLLTAEPAEGDVLVVLQPGEEVGRGARAVLDTGVLDGVAAIFGGHVDRRFALGEIVVQEGPLAASSDSFHVTLTGVGAHGARPHESADPIVGLGALIGALQTIVSRRVNPADPAVVSIGKVEGGAAPNVIPGDARLSGTLRAMDNATRRLLHEEVTRIAHDIAQAYRLKAVVSITDGTLPIVNPPGATAWARKAAAEVLGENAIVPLGYLNMAGEDFSYYMDKMPGCFMRIGAREPGGEIIPAHAPYFYAAEESIFIGAAVLAEAARVASAELSGNACRH